MRALPDEVNVTEEGGAGEHAEHPDDEATTALGLGQGHQ